MAKKNSDPEGLAFAQHDHGACAADALDYARGVCAQQGLRLTPVRERVLQLLLESHSALGAYDLLEKLKADVVMISDSTMFAHGIPSIGYGLRGLSYLQINVQGPDRDLHSGSFGGPVENPAFVLSEIIASLKY